MANEQSEELQRVLQKMAAHLGKDFEVMPVYDDIDLVSGDDEILAGGAAPRLGLDEADIEVLQNERLMHGDDVMDVILKGLEDLEAGSKKKTPAKKTKAAAKEAEAPEEKPAAPAKKEKPAPVEKNFDETEGDITIVLTALKQNGATDNTVAQGIGVSRGTYINYVNGKTEFTPNEDQKAFLRDEVVTRINSLHEALASLDGTEPEVVF